MARSREFKIGVACFVVAGALGLASACMQQEESGTVGGGAAAITGEGVPIFQVDPLWPRPLPNHWVLGSTIGIDVDSRDHVWIIHRQATVIPQELLGELKNAECCFAAPPVLEFDADGNVVGSWGGEGEGYDWPESNHGITVDHMDNIWIGGNGNEDSHLLKFTRDGRFLMQVGQPHMRTGSNDTKNFWKVAEIEIDADANEAYVSDGYGNRRVAVLDMTTGEMKRYWGAYGNRPDDGPLPVYSPDAPPAQQFRSPMHCAALSVDDLVYACDRAGDRIQVFNLDGTFVREAFFAPETLGSGSVWDIAFSTDPEQRWLYLADGSNEKIYVIERSTLEIVTEFGDGGRYPGTFLGVHSIAVDSRGNIYTTETYEGKRVQKHTLIGFGNPPRDQGVVRAAPGAQ